MTQHPRIFVQIACYRDPDLQHTIKDAFDKAAHPERVFFGICWQYVPEEDKDCFVVPHPLPQNVRISEIHAKDSPGLCWARAQTQALWRGEEFTMQVDSHMRFEPGWDQMLIDMHAACVAGGSPKAVLATYPPGFTPPNEVQRGWIMTMVGDKFDDNGIFLMKGHGIAEADAPATPIPGAFIGGCFLFGPSQIIQDVPYDPDLYFFGEEIQIAVRLWTHGWDIYHPNKIVLFHNWDRKGRVTHFEDHKDWGARNDLSFKRVKHMLGTEISTDPRVLANLDKFGLGNVRSLEAYQEYSGVNFKTRTISDKARNGLGYSRPTASTKPAASAAAASTLSVSSLTVQAPTTRAELQQQITHVLSKHQHVHHPKKVYESAEGIVYDDFLPEETYDAIYERMCTSDYEVINTQGKVVRAWHIRDGFPLRGTLNAHYFADESKKPGGDWVYPTNTAVDKFIDQMNRMLPQVEHFIGAPGKDWDKYSVTQWLYPVGTALSLHDDGSGIYSGAYAYFVNPHWNIHWGGLLMLLAAETNKRILAHKSSGQIDAMKFHLKKWLDDSEEQAFMWDPGFAQCVFPKRNRIAFINNETYHMVTKVNPEAGDNHRMSLAGFFTRPR